MGLKVSFFFFIIVASLIPICAKESSDLLSIYFLENKVDKDTHWGYKESYNHKELKEIIANCKPTFTLDDINAYDWNNHFIFLNKKGWKKLYSNISAKKQKNCSVLFVVELNKEQLYYGFVVHKYIPYYPLKPFTYFEYFEKERNNRGAHSFPIIFNTYNKKHEVDPRFSPALYHVLSKHLKIINCNSPIISILSSNTY